MVNGLREGARICLAIGTAGSGGVYFPERERAGHNSAPQMTLWQKDGQMP